MQPLTQLGRTNRLLNPRTQGEVLVDRKLTANTVAVSSSPFHAGNRAASPLTAGSAFPTWTRRFACCGVAARLSALLSAARGLVWVMDHLGMGHQCFQSSIKVHFNSVSGLVASVLPGSREACVPVLTRLGAAPTLGRLAGGAEPRALSRGGPRRSRQAWGRALAGEGSGCAEPEGSPVDSGW